MRRTGEATRAGLVACCSTTRQWRPTMCRRSSAKLERKQLMAIYHWQGMRAELQNAAGAFDDALTSLASGLKIADQTHGQRMDPIAAISLSNATPPRQPAQSADPLWRFGCHRIEGRALSIFETTSLSVRART